MMMKELWKAARYQFLKEDYIREEGPTFNALGWSLMCITPFSFLHSFLSMGILYEDDRISEYKASPSSNTTTHLDLERTLDKLKTSAEAYLDQWEKKTWCLLYKDARKYRPSVVAICCVLAARSQHGVIPILSDRFKEMALMDVCYEQEDPDVYEEIKECFEIMSNIEKWSHKS